MTVDELIALARTVHYDEDYAPARLAPAILDLLAEDAPCGFDAPRVRDGFVHVPWSWAGSTSYEPDDARALARMLLRAADEADAKGKP